MRLRISRFRRHPEQISGGFTPIKDMGGKGYTRAGYETNKELMGVTVLQTTARTSAAASGRPATA